MVDIYEELALITDALNRASVPFALCGGLAVVVHGYVRATKDIDLLVPAQQVERARAAVHEVGYRLPALPMRFRRGTPDETEVHRISKSFDEDILTLDLLVVGPASELAWSGRLLLDWNGRTIPVVSREGLARMKRAAGRPQDLLDIEKLENPDE